MLCCWTYSWVPRVVVIESSVCTYIGKIIGLKSALVMPNTIDFV